MEEKTITPKIKYQFVCTCGQMSQELGKEVIKLRKFQKWVCKDCKDEKEVVQEFKGGYIIKENEF